MLFPVLSGPGAVHLRGQRDREPARNVWAFTIIFRGHFPDGAEEWSEEETDDETRGEWYFRQILGSANLKGGKLFHILSGNLSFQIEHHLYPDMPAHRYAEIAVEVREVCERYGMPYNTVPLASNSAVSSARSAGSPSRNGATVGKAGWRPPGDAACRRRDSNPRH